MKEYAVQIPFLQSGLGDVLAIRYSDPGSSFALVRWVSSDESIATVDEYGKVYGVAEGTATITVTILPHPSFHQIPSESATATVVVSKEPFVSS